MLPGTTENPKDASPTHAASKKMLLFAASLSGMSLQGFHWGPACEEGNLCYLHKNLARETVI